MKKNLIYILAFFAFLLVQACSSESKTEEKTEADTILKADWSDKKKIILLASNYFLKGSLLKNPPSPHDLFTDPSDQKNYFYQASFSENDSLFQESANTAFLKVNATTPDKSPLVVDYKIVWKNNAGKGEFVVEELVLRSFKTEERYFWKKQGNFWERIIIAKPI